MRQSTYQSPDPDPVKAEREWNELGPMQVLWLDTPVVEPTPIDVAYEQALIENLVWDLFPDQRDSVRGQP